MRSALHKFFHFLPFGFILLGMIVLTACSSGQGTTSQGRTSSSTSSATVIMANLDFTPKTLTVKVGTTVTWVNQGNETYTVTSDSGLFDSGDVSIGATWSYTFNKAGTFPYHDVIHDSDDAGTVVVK